jgi:hypothetical protein
MDGCCHRGGSQPQRMSQRRSRRGWDLAAGALSLGVWALMPKCPLCLAAHLALWTGLGFSLAAATYLRWSLLSLSGMLLLYVAWRRKGLQGVGWQTFARIVR